MLTHLDEAHTGSADYIDDDADLFIGRMKSRLPSSYEADPETICIQKEQMEELYAEIHEFSPHHHTWVLCRYGFDDDVYKSLAEMGRIWHLSESRAMKTEEETVGKVRRKMKHARC